jgi:hypothetical protein
MTKPVNDSVGDWEDHEVATTIYQDGMLEQARAELLERASKTHTPGEDSGEEIWFISQDGAKQQTLTAREVVERCRAGTVSEQTLVWHDGLDGWTKLGDVPELKRVLRVLGDAHQPGNAPQGDKLKLPPVPAPPPSRPPQSQPMVSKLPPVPAPPRAANAISKQPTPLAPRFESQPTQVYAGEVVTELKAQLAPSNPAAHATEGGIESSAVNVPRRAEIASQPEFKPVSRTRYVATMCVAFGASMALGAMAFKDERVPATSLPSVAVVYDLDPPGSGSLNASTVALQTAQPEPLSTATPPTASADSEMAKAISAALTGAEPGAEASSGKNPGLKDNFDEAAARGAMSAAAERAANCRPKDGPRGSGEVQVKIEPSGDVSSAIVLTKQFNTTTTEGCVTMVFRQAKVPPFKGSAKTIVQRFSIPD